MTGLCREATFARNASRWSSVDLPVSDLSGRRLSPPSIYGLSIFALSGDSSCRASFFRFRAFSSCRRGTSACRSSSPDGLKLSALRCYDAVLG